MSISSNYLFLDNYFCKAPDVNATNCTVEFIDKDQSCKPNDEGFYQTNCMIKFKAANGSIVDGGHDKTQCRGRSRKDGNWNEKRWPQCHKQGRRPK